MLGPQCPWLYIGQQTREGRQGTTTQGGSASGCVWNAPAYVFSSSLHLSHHLIWEYLPLEKEELDTSSQLSGASPSPPSLIPTGSQDGHPHPPARGLTQLCSISLVHTSRKPKSTRLLRKASNMKETQPTHTGKNHLEEIIHKRKKTTKPEEALISLER